jgi:hypothetical protein
LRETNRPRGEEGGGGDAVSPQQRRNRMRQSIFTLFIFCLLTAAAFAADPKAITDPDRFSEEILNDFSGNRISDVATKIADVVGIPEQKANVENSLKLLEGRKFEYRKKVVDRDYAGALRQIVHYAFVRDVGFVYFRFNYKQTGSGWVLANFNYTSETNELFPPALNIE